MTENAQIAHDGAGRLRLKIPARRRDVAYFAAVRGALCECPGVSEIESNVLTGSVLIRHASNSSAIIDYGTRAGLFRVAESGNGSFVPRMPLLTRLSAQMAAFDTQLREYSGGYVDIATLIFFLLLVMGIYQLQQGQVLAPAATLLWYAATLALG